MGERRQVIIRGVKLACFKVSDSGIIPKHLSPPWSCLESPFNDADVSHSLSLLISTCLLVLHTICFAADKRDFVNWILLGSTASFTAGSMMFSLKIFSLPSGESNSFAMNSLSACVWVFAFAELPELVYGYFCIMVWLLERLKIFF